MAQPKLEYIPKNRAVANESLEIKKKERKH